MCTRYRKPVIPIRVTLNFLRRHMQIKSIASNYKETIYDGAYDKYKNCMFHSEINHSFSSSFLSQLDLLHTEIFLTTVRLDRKQKTYIDVVFLFSFFINLE